MESRLVDGYMATALQMFEGCGMDSSGELPVDTLMDNFALYVPNEKSEYSELRSLLDPERRNRSIGATELAAALERYGERQHVRTDFDDSINLRNGHTPLDSDSGISTDIGYQLLEELQGELRDKTQAVRRLLRQQEAAERQHEETLSGVAAECASLRSQLQLMREENCALVSVRRECEEASERLVAAEASAEERGRQLDAARRKLTVLQRSLDKLENEKSTLQTLLAKSKEECHRINDMYAARQATLLEENETFRSDYADLSTRFQEQEECLQQTLKEKVLLEMEVSDVLNRSRPADVVRALDRSVEVSYTEAQLLQTLDTMNSLDGDPEEAVVSVATQASAACSECEARAAAPAAPSRTPRSYLWEFVRCSLQLVAVLCLAVALVALCNVTHYSYASRRCVRSPRLLPWRWLALDDLVNFLFRIEYIGEVPM